MSPREPMDVMDESFRALALGEKMRSLRERRERSVAQVAAAARVGEEALADYEAGRADPSIGELMRIGSYLDVPIDWFFQRTLPERRLEIVRAAERFVARPQSEAAASLGYRYQALSHGLTDKRMEPFLVEIPPSSEERMPVSAHEGEEFLFVLAGRLELTVDGEPHVLGAGDAAYYDSHLEHALRALDGTTVRLVACVAEARRPRPEDPLGRALDR